VLPALPIAENLQRCDRALCITCKGKEVSYSRSYNDEWFLNSSASVPFESDFVSITQGNYGRIETANSKAPLFMVAVGTVLIEHKIIDPKNRTTRTAISKLWPVYCVPGMTIHLLSTGQLLQSGLSIEGTIDSSTFCDSSGDAVLSALPNLWGSIQVVRTCIIKNNVPNPMSLVTRHPDYETIHCQLGHISDEAMRHISDNVEGAEKICFPNKKHICHGRTLGKLHQHSFPENPKCSSETLGLIHSDLLELLTLSYSKYKWVITFLDDYSFYCRVAFLHKKSDAAEAIKAIFWLWSNTTSHSVKCLHTDNGREYMTLELQFFLCEQGIVHETSTPHVHQQNSQEEQLNQILLEKVQSMQLKACLSDSWWESTFATATHVYNCTPIKHLKWKTP